MEYVANFKQFDGFLRDNGVYEDEINEIKGGINKNSMALKISKHLLSLINWRSLHSDPLRKQFFPLESEYKKDHKFSSYDSLSEIKNRKNYRIIHRYPNKILFIASRSCNTYCAFCTRSYMVGPETKKNKQKFSNLSSILKEIDQLKKYLTINSHIKDVVISGGDVSTIKNDILVKILTTLNSIDSVTSVRLSTSVSLLR